MRCDTNVSSLHVPEEHGQGPGQLCHHLYLKIAEVFMKMILACMQRLLSVHIV
jgi:hypothetical protein